VGDRGADHPRADNRQYSASDSSLVHMDLIMKTKTPVVFLAAVMLAISWIGLVLLVFVLALLHGCAGRDCVSQVDRDAFAAVCNDCHVEGDFKAKPEGHDRMVMAFGAAYTSKWCDE